METSIIVVTCNNIELTKQCIESVRKYTKDESYSLIVVDNGSSDGTAEWLREQTDLKCILNNSNRGFVSACNQGIKIAENNDVLLLSNDVIVTLNWLHNLNKCLYSSRDIGAAGAVTNYASYYQSISIPYQNTGELEDFAQKYNISDLDLWEERLKLLRFCMLIRREVIDKIGLFDERFSPGNYEDDDYSLRIRLEGYKLMLCKDVFVHHHGSATFAKDMEAYGKLLSHNLMEFEDKWALKHDDLFNVRWDILQCLDEDENSRFSFLHIDCRGAGTLLYISSKYKNAHLYGIEKNQKLLVNVEHFAHIKVSQPGGISFDKNLFDYVFIEDQSLDIALEKITNIMQSIKTYSTIIISINKKISEKKCEKTVNDRFGKVNLKYRFDGIYSSLIIKLQQNSLIMKRSCKQLTKENKELDNSKIDFICCIRDYIKINKTLEHIKMLNLPESFNAEFIGIENSKSTAAAYNLGMEKSNAKYKVYIQDDVIITNRNFLSEIIDIFNNDNNIGMIGVEGGDDLSSDRQSNLYQTKFINGLIMVTQYDLPWREDLFDGQYFYESAQCLEFTNAGFQIVVPLQSKTWYNHELNLINDTAQLEKYRRIFNENYGVSNIGVENKSINIVSLCPKSVTDRIKEAKLLDIIGINKSPWDSRLVIYENADYYEGLNIEKVVRFTDNEGIDVYAYLVENSMNIDVLVLYELSQKSIRWIDIYKLINFEGKAIIKLGVNIETCDITIQKESLKNCDFLIVESKHLYEYFKNEFSVETELIES